MKIVTWNVNSIRTRLDRALAWVDAHAPEVLALQEIKVVDGDFPRAPFEERGYHIETAGQPTYNGVALLTRHPPEDVSRVLPGDVQDAEARYLAATVAGVRVVNVYVPNGKHVTSDKYAWKLAWLDRLHEEVCTDLAPEHPTVLLGDFNIAPEDRDVYDPEAWGDAVHAHPLERKMLQRFFEAGMHDLFRSVCSDDGCYSWWDYRGGGFPRNRGLRIDLVLGTDAVRDRLQGATIHRDERAEREDAGKPSDHAPVEVVLA